MKSFVRDLEVTHVNVVIEKPIGVSHMNRQMMFSLRKIDNLIREIKTWVWLLWGRNMYNH